uniref:Uncharacterized protein n=1 Tax=Candidatus Kentrum sp. FW TaxID=2126338 RepID=A0A450TYG0_9GAMM|nr:MAG: hypothetical protein BECKFW1821C_GA0114237_106410 [Candidatus Kentron sp. FW]
MFDNDMFGKWLDGQSQEIVEKMGQGGQLRAEEIMVPILEAQSNRFYHLDKDLRNEMKILREDMNYRFESMDKRFEQVIQRIDRFMFWSLGITVAAAVFVVDYPK